MEVDFSAILQTLARAEVRFILIGGLAGIAHGAERSTGDVDVVYERTPDNLNRLVAALAPFAPYLRGAPPGLPFRLDFETLKRGLNFTLNTSLGPVDLLGEVAGGGSYAELRSHATEVEAFDSQFQVVSLRKLIDLKRAAGRPKDFEAIAELETILERRADDPA